MTNDLDVVKIEIAALVEASCCLFRVLRTNSRHLYGVFFLCVDVEDAGGYAMVSAAVFWKNTALSYISMSR